MTTAELSQELTWTRIKITRLRQDAKGKYGSVKSWPEGLQWTYEALKQRARELSEFLCSP